MPTIFVGEVVWMVGVGGIGAVRGLDKKKLDRGLARMNAD
jgi:hypothetical protein